MSIFGTILADVGFGTATGAVQPNGYTFTQQDKDFIKAQFRYGLILKQRLDAGTLPGVDSAGKLILSPLLGGNPNPDEQQAYYNSHLWLTTQTLQVPYAGYWDEFKTAISSEDLQWLARQVGETVEQVTAYMGDALGSVVASAISGVAGGVAKGFFGSLNVWGWLAIGGAGVALYYGWKKGLIQSAFRTKLNISL